MPLSRRPSGDVGTLHIQAALEAAVAQLGTMEWPPAEVGIDVVDVVEFEHNHAVGGERWLRKLFSPNELSQCESHMDRLAARFAAKEAVAKAIGWGFRAGVAAREIEIVTAREGRPRVQLHGKAAVVAADAGLDRLHVSMTREGNCAAALAIAVRKAGPHPVETADD